MLDTRDYPISPKLLAMYVLATCVGIFAVVVIYLQVRGGTVVEDFESCAQAGGEVQEQFPRRCVWRDTTYVEELNVPGVDEIDIDRETAIRDTIVVGARYVPCPQDEASRCLEIDGDPFDGRIEGYDYEEGYIHKMIVQKITRNGEAEPYRYVFEDVVSSHYVFTPEPEPEPVEPEPEPEPARPTTQELVMSVGRFVLECDETESGRCLVVNGEVFGYPIEGFSHQSGYSYELRVLETNQTREGEVIEDGSFVRYLLLEELSREGLPSQSSASTTASSSTSASSSDSGE